MKAEIITIGDEILIGQIVDTNSAWIAQKLNQLGIEVYQITSVSDDDIQIQQALKNAEEKVDLVILTGGLGPTRDDITRNTLCEYFNTKLTFHEATFETIKRRFANRNIPLNKLNRDQALLPEKCLVLENAEGTAPGMWFEKNGVIFVSVPGVPFEMKYLVSEQILPRLKQLGKTKNIHHKTILTQGIPESVLAEMLGDFEDNLPGNMKLAYLPNPMEVRLRISAFSENGGSLEQEVQEQVEKLQAILGDDIYGFDEDELAEVIGKEMVQKGKTLAVAESCSGGYISHLITSIPGSSEYFKGGITAYSNEIKNTLLNVNQDTLYRVGAVSKEVAIEMVLGVKAAMKTDYAIATTGIAGPGGGTEEKPVGTVWIAVAGTEKLISKKFVFGNNRERNILRTSQTALQLLRKLMIKENKVSPRKAL